MNKIRRQPLFNSLGSNYSFEFVQLALKNAVGVFGPNAKNSITELTQKIESTYNSTAYFFYKGRDAIEFALRIAGVGPGDYVMTQALACFAIEEAIVRVGATPLYVDVASNGVNASEAEFKKTLEACDDPTRIKAVLVQHLLGYPVAMNAIATWCKQKKIFLIEDLAQSVSAMSNEKQVGSWGDCVIFSFGRDKVLDAVSGGACAVRNKTLLPKAETEYQAILGRTVPRSIIVKDMVYPFLTWIIRSTFAFGLGKLLLLFSKSTGLLTSPTKSPSQQAWPLPNAYFSLILMQWKNIGSQLDHRRRLANSYWQNLVLETKPNALFSETNLDEAVHLRVPVLVTDIHSLTKELQDAGYYLSDRWYTRAADSGSLGYPSVYKQGSCTTTEFIGAHIFNLPTHQFVSIKDTKMLATIVKKYLYKGKNES